MIQTFLITGGTKEERMLYIRDKCKEWHVKSFDQSELRKKDEEKESFGISDIRIWQKTLFLSPHGSSYTVGIIPDAHLLTTEAQQALLKTLEEPPGHVRIFLETDTSEALLPTIISRSTIERIGNQKPSPVAKERIDLLLASPGKTNGEAVSFVDTHIEKKTDARNMVENLLYAFHTLLIHPALRKTYGWKTMHIEKCIRSIIKAQNQLQANVNYRLVMDRIFFTILALQPKD